MLGWLVERRSFFDPQRHGLAAATHEIPLAELAMLTINLLRSGTLVAPETTSLFLDVLDRAGSEDGFRERPFRDAQSMVPHLLVAVALAEGGIAPAHHDVDRLAEVIRLSSLGAPRLAPHRQLELRHACDLAGVPVDLPGYRELFLRTLLAEDLNPIYLSRPDFYIATHVVFYLSDMGFLPIRGLLPADVTRLAELVDRLLGMAIVSGNPDLAAELIISARCLGGISPFEPAGWTYLASVQQPDGSIPGYRLRGETTQMPTTQIPTTPVEVFESSYHTTLVTALAALTQLRMDGR